MNDPIKLHVVCGTTLFALTLMFGAPAEAQKNPDGSKATENRAQTVAPPTEGNNPNLHSHSQPLNGVDVTIRVVHGDAKAAKEAIGAVFQEFRRIQRKLAANGRLSELRSVNKHADTEEVFLSRETYILVQRAMHLCKLTKGAFDPTIQSLSYLWNFSHRPFVRPLDEEVKSRMRYVGCDKIALKPNRALVSKAPRLRLSLHELTHGHMLNRASEIFAKHGVESMRISIGRDVYVRGRIGSRHWYMSVGHPNRPGQDLLQLYVGSHAVATRSWSDRFALRGKQRYHDVFDPRTGKPAAGVIQTTVISTDAVLADALSAAIFVLGPKQGIALLNELKQAEGFIIDTSGKVFGSRGMADYGRLPARIAL